MHDDLEQLKTLLASVHATLPVPGISLSYESTRDVILGSHEALDVLYRIVRGLHHRQAILEELHPERRTAACNKTS